MNGLEKRSFVEYLSRRYRHSSKLGKGKLIREVCECLNVGTRQARRLLGSKSVGRPRKPDFRGRPSKYRDPEFIAALKYVWKRTRYMCSRHLKSAIPEWLPCIEDEQGIFSTSIRERLLSVSAPTIDRILKPYKGIKGKSFTRSGGFRDEMGVEPNC